MVKSDLEDDCGDLAWLTVKLTLDGNGLGSWMK